MGGYLDNTLYKDNFANGTLAREAASLEFFHLGELCLVICLQQAQVNVEARD